MATQPSPPTAQPTETKQTIAKDAREKELLLELVNNHGYQFAQSSGSQLQMMMQGHMVVPFRILKLYVPNNSHLASRIEMKTTPVAKATTKRSKVGR